MARANDTTALTQSAQERQILKRTTYWIPNSSWATPVITPSPKTGRGKLRNGTCGSTLPKWNPSEEKMSHPVETRTVGQPPNSPCEAGILSKNRRRPRSRVSLKDVKTRTEPDETGQDDFERRMADVDRLPEPERLVEETVVREGVGARRPRGRSRHSWPVRPPGSALRSGDHRAGKERPARRGPGACCAASSKTG